MTQTEINALKATNYADLDVRRQSHESNKREAFDGMRAYHSSEIEHKKDAIEILKTILTSSILIYSGLLAAIYGKLVKNEYIICLDFVVTALIVMSVFTIVWTTIVKINADNKRYGEYRAEYVIERDILGLEDDLKAMQFTSKWLKPSDPDKTGFHFTKLILIWYGITILTIAAVGAIIVYIGYYQAHIK